jgi:hypothetical protein
LEAGICEVADKLPGVQAFDAKGCGDGRLDGMFAGDFEEDHVVFLLVEAGFELGIVAGILDGETMLLQSPVHGGTVALGVAGQEDRSILRSLVRLIFGLFPGLFATSGHYCSSCYFSCAGAGRRFNKASQSIPASAGEEKCKGQAKAAKCGKSSG